MMNEHELLSKLWQLVTAAAHWSALPVAQFRRQLSALQPDLAPRVLTVAGDAGIHQTPLMEKLLQFRVALQLFENLEPKLEK